MNYFNINIAGNTLQAWTFALTTGVITFVAMRVLKKVLIHRVGALAAKTETTLDDLFVDIITSTKFFFLLAVAIFAGSFFVQLGKMTPVLNKAIVIACFLQSAICGTSIINFWIERHMKRKAQNDAVTATTIGLMSFIARTALYVILALVTLNNLGVDITALVAGLGVGGIAIALAVQNILGDLFASLTIVLDRPFVVGDFVSVDDLSGAIEHIGLKTTRVRSLSGEQLIFSNTDLLKSRVRNFKRMQERRVIFSVGVTYQTPAEKLERIPALLREIVQKHQKVRFERSHFNLLSSSSLNIETVYWVTEADYAVHMDIQQAILLEIYRRFEQEKIDFAYPTQTLHIQNTSAPLTITHHAVNQPTLQPQ